MWCAQNRHIPRSSRLDQVLLAAPDLIPTRAWTEHLVRVDLTRKFVLWVLWDGWQTRTSRCAQARPQTTQVRHQCFGDLGRCAYSPCERLLVSLLVFLPFFLSVSRFFLRLFFVRHCQQSGQWEAKSWSLLMRPLSTTFTRMNSLISLSSMIACRSESLFWVFWSGVFQLLEISGYLENYLWKYFDDTKASFAHVMSIIILVSFRLSKSANFFL